jgi:hypothetical protein
MEEGEICETFMNLINNVFLHISEVTAALFHFNVTFVQMSSNFISAIREE